MVPALEASSLLVIFLNQDISNDHVIVCVYALKDWCNFIGKKLYFISLFLL